MACSGYSRRRYKGLAIAREMDDIALQSAALDGLSASAMQRGDWARSRETSRSRLHLGERLDLTERMDSYSVTRVDLGRPWRPR